jgi:hypothetical protein
VLIVSRDSDYGVTHEREAILNDLLCQEFKDRVSQKRKILLTNKLTTAWQQLDERVAPEDIKQEEKILKEDNEGRDRWDAFGATTKTSNENIGAWIKDYESIISNFSSQVEAIRNELTAKSVSPDEAK